MQEKEKEKHTNEDGGSKTVFADSLVVYVENKKQKKQLEKVRARLQDTRSLYKNHILGSSDK